jgi:predicted DCC family thiol-disulfide oxidoreductase YuxK
MSNRPSIADRWDALWFAEASLTRLGALRILICGLAMYDVVLYRYVVFHDAESVTAGAALRPWNPIYLFDVLGLQPIGADAAWWVFVAALTTLGMATIGILSRLSCLIGFLLFVYWTGLAYSFGKPHHDKIALTFALLALPFAPCGARLSLDSLLARFRNAGRGGDPAVVPESSPWAGFPILLTQITIALGYFLPGVSKLWIGGLEWMNGYTLQGIVMGHDNTWSAFFSRNLMLCRINSIGLVLTQACFPLVFLWRPLLWYFVPAATTFHLITWQTMDTGPYMRLWFTMVAFLPLERVPATLRGWLRASPLGAAGAILLIAAPATLVFGILAMHMPAWIPALVFAFPTYALALYLTPRAAVDLVYDGSCRMCRRAAAVVLALDWAQRVRPLSLSDWQAVSRAHPDLDRDACIRDMHVVDAGGRVTTGYSAYRVLCPRLPLVAWITPLLYVPPVAWLGRRAYRRIADRRLRDGCGDAACPVHPGR